MMMMIVAINFILTVTEAKQSSLRHIYIVLHVMHDDEDRAWNWN